MAQNSKGTRVNSEKCPSHACLSAVKSKVLSEAHMARVLYGLLQRYFMHK